MHPRVGQLRSGQGLELDPPQETVLLQTDQDLGGNRQVGQLARSGGRQDPDRGTVEPAAG